MAAYHKEENKMAGTKNTKDSTPALIRSVAKKITTNPKFATDANMMMSAGAVIERARKAGKSDAEIGKMSAAQLRKLL